MMSVGDRNIKPANQSPPRFRFNRRLPFPEELKKDFWARGLVIIK